MFLINIIDYFIKLDFIIYLFCAFGFYGLNLALKKLILKK